MKETGLVAGRLVWSAFTETYSKRILHARTPRSRQLSEICYFGGTEGVRLVTRHDGGL
jgi:hypothetical protein